MLLGYHRRTPTLLTAALTPPSPRYRGDGRRGGKHALNAIGRSKGATKDSHAPIVFGVAFQMLVYT